MQSDALRELVAAADVIRTRLATLPIGWEVQWAREEADLMLTAEARLTAAVEAVKAEGKPQRDPWGHGKQYDHQTGGK